MCPALARIDTSAPHAAPSACARAMLTKASVELAMTLAGNGSWAQVLQHGLEPRADLDDARHDVAPVGNGRKAGAAQDFDQVGHRHQPEQDRKVLRRLACLV